MQLFRTSFFPLFIFTCLLVHVKAAPVNHLPANNTPRKPVPEEDPGLVKIRKAVDLHLQGVDVGPVFKEKHENALGLAGMEAENYARRKGITLQKAHVAYMFQYARDRAEAVKETQDSERKAFMYGAHYHSAQLIHAGRWQNQANGGGTGGPTHEMAHEFHGTESSRPSSPAHGKGRSASCPPGGNCGH